MFQDNMKIHEDGLLEIPVWGFIQSKSVLVSVWHNWLGNDQDQITWETSIGSIEFTYKQAINELEDSSQEWVPLKAGMRKRLAFHTRSCPPVTGAVAFANASSGSPLLHQ